MGCFDFTYADNGMNTRGGKGFLYLSNCFAKAARLQNPLRYSETDWYGRLSTPIGAEKSLVELDITGNLKGLRASSATMESTTFSPCR